MRIRSGLILFVALLVAAALAPAGAGAANVKNHGFESDDLRGWEKDFFPRKDTTGAWFTYDGPFTPISPRGEAVIPPPPEGEFGAVTDQINKSAMFISQVVHLAPGKHHELSFKLAYHTDSSKTRRLDPPPPFTTPNNFKFRGDAANQQFRMDVMKAGAPIKSLRRTQILKRVYRTVAGDPASRSFHKVTANLNKLAGKDVRLRFGVVVTDFPLNVAIDDVKVKTTN